MEIREKGSEKKTRELCCPLTASFFCSFVARVDSCSGAAVVRIVTTAADSVAMQYRLTG